MSSNGNYKSAKKTEIQDSTYRENIVPTLSRREVAIFKSIKTFLIDEIKYYSLCISKNINIHFGRKNGGFCYWGDYWRAVNMVDL